MHNFRAEIYKVGINAVVDVPAEVTSALHEGKGYIRIKGAINGFAFSTTLLPVKGKPYRLFVNIPMLKGGNTALGDTAKFSIAPETAPVDHDYPMVLSFSSLQLLNLLISSGSSKSILSWRCLPSGVK